MVVGDYQVDVVFPAIIGGFKSRDARITGQNNLRTRSISTLRFGRLMPCDSLARQEYDRLHCRLTGAEH